MPVFSNTNNVGIGATIADVMTGSVFKRVDHDTLVRIGFAAELLLATARVTIGSRVVTETYAITVEAMLGAGVDVGRDVKIVGHAFAGEEIIISTTNGAAALNEINTYVIYP